MIIIRDFQEGDAERIGQLIAETYGKYNLDFLTEEEKGPFLGPFRHAWSSDRVHQEAIGEVIKSPILFVAEDDGKIVGVLRGRKERLASLFVRGDRHRQGIGRKLVQRFEEESMRQGVTVVRLASSLFAVPFYQSMGYKKSTGIHSGWSFDGHGLQVQPMRKVLKKSKSRMRICQ